MEEQLSTAMVLWYNLYKSYRDGLHMSQNDITEFLRLNHRIMEEVHKVHNESMSNEPFKNNK